MSQIDKSSKELNDERNKRLDLEELMRVKELQTK